MGLGIGISALLVELAPAPRVLPYVVLFALFAIAFYGALRMPEPVAGHRPRQAHARSARASRRSSGARSSWPRWP